MHSGGATPSPGSRCKTRKGCTWPSKSVTAVSKTATHPPRPLLLVKGGGGRGGGSCRGERGGGATNMHSICRLPPPPLAELSAWRP